MSNTINNPSLPDVPAEHFRPNVDFVPLDEATPRYKKLGQAARELLVENMGLKQETLTDPLTGLANEKAIDLALRGAITREEEAGAKKGDESNIAMLEFDLDKFKSINDTLGHGVGDRIIQIVAEGLAGIVRETDTPGRPHGDEFRLLISNIMANTDTDMPKEERLRAVSGRARAAIMDALQASEYAEKLAELGVGVSVGSGFYRHGETVPVFKKRVDEAMYDDKTARKAA